MCQCAIKVLAYYDTYSDNFGGALSTISSSEAALPVMHMEILIGKFLDLAECTISLVACETSFLT